MDSQIRPQSLKKIVVISPSDVVFEIEYFYCKYLKHSLCIDIYSDTLKVDIVNLCYLCLLFQEVMSLSTAPIYQSIKCISKAHLTSADVTKCCTETQPKAPNSKQCRCRSTVARKNSLERPEPRKNPREESGYEGWPVFFWLCRVEIITEHGQDVKMFIDDQQGQIIIITVVVEGASGQIVRSNCQLAFHSRSFRVMNSDS